MAIRIKTRSISIAVVPPAQRSARLLECFIRKRNHCSMLVGTCVFTCSRRNKSQKSTPTASDMIESEPYIHVSFGSTVTGKSAELSALPIAEVKRNKDMTTDFIDAGACVKAYSRPVIDAKISETAMKKYEGICQAPLMLLYCWQVRQGFVV